MRTLLVLLVACTSSSSSSSISVSGSLGGKALAIKSAAATVFTDSKGSSLMIYLSPDADACTATADVPAGGSALEFALYQQQGGAIVSDMDLKTYSTDVTTAGPWVEIDTIQRGTDCTATAAEGKGQGSVMLTKASGGVYAGTFDFTHGTDHITGSFTTDACAWTPPTTICQ